MNQKVLLGGLAVIVIVVAAYFIFFSGGASGRPCNQEAMTALLPKITEAASKLTPEEATKMQAELTEMMNKASSMSESEACDALYGIADKLKVQ